MSGLPPRPNSPWLRSAMLASGTLFTLALGTRIVQAQETGSAASRATAKPKATAVQSAGSPVPAVAISAKASAAPSVAAAAAPMTTAPVIAAPGTPSAATEKADKPALQSVTVAAPAAAYVVREQDSVNVDLATETVALKRGELLVMRSRAKTPLLPEPPVLRDPSVQPPSKHVKSDDVATSPAPSVTPPEPGTEMGVALPYEARFVNEGGELKTSEVVAQIVGGGLRMVAAPRRFVATLYVKLQDQSDRAAAYDLPTGMELLINGALDTVVPTLLSIANTNRWHPVQLETTTPLEPVTLSVTTPADALGLTLTIPVIRPTLHVDVVPPRIQGFGLEAAEVVVQVEGLPAPEGYTVVLKANGGQLSTTRLNLDAQGTAVAQLRSSGTGPVHVEVSGASLVTGTSSPDVGFAWPWRFLVFATLGAGLGAAISAMTHKKKHSRRWLRTQIPASTGFGLLVAVASAVGVNLLSIELPSSGGEALFFLVAALGGLGSLAMPKLMKPQEAAVKTG